MQPGPVRLWVSPAKLDESVSAGGWLILSDRDHRYLTRTLRLTLGATLQLFDGAGRACLGEITAIDGEQVTCRTAAVTITERSKAVAVELAVALLKGDKLEWVLQKATEIGADRISVVSTEHSIVRLDSERAERRHARWMTVVREAARQCGRAAVPEVSPLMGIGDWLRNTTANALSSPNGPASTEEPVATREFRLICAEPSIASGSAPPALPITDLLADAKQSGFSAVSLLVGPEGGFSKDELRLAEEAGMTFASLGPRVLRAETAALVAVTLAMAAVGDMGRSDRL